MKPRPIRSFQVLYLFAGEEQRADMGSCLYTLIQAFNAEASFGFSVTLQVIEVDLLRELLQEHHRSRYLQLLEEACDACLSAPPCNTHTRARHSGFPGPRPVRDSTWPRGRPDLTPAEVKAVPDANILVITPSKLWRLRKPRERFVCWSFPRILAARRGAHLPRFGKTLR